MVVRSPAEDRLHVAVVVVQAAKHVWWHEERMLLSVLRRIHVFIRWRRRPAAAMAAVVLPPGTPSLALAKEVMLLADRLTAELKTRVPCC